MHVTAAKDRGITTVQNPEIGRLKNDRGMRTRGEVEGLLMEHMEMLCLIAMKFSKEPRRAEQLVSRTMLAALRSPELRSWGVYPKPWLIMKLRHLHNTRKPETQSRLTSC